MGYSRTTVILAAVLAVVCVAGTVTAFGIGQVLQDDVTYPIYEVSGTLADGSPATGTATCTDTGESESASVLRFEYTLTSGGSEVTLESYLIMVGDRPADIYTAVGTGVTLGQDVTLWRDPDRGFTYRIAEDGRVLGIDISEGGVTAAAVQSP